MYFCYQSTLLFRYFLPNVLFLVSILIFFQGFVVQNWILFYFRNDFFRFVWHCDFLYVSFTKNHEMAQLFLKNMWQDSAKLIHGSPNYHKKPRELPQKIALEAITAESSRDHFLVAFAFALCLNGPNAIHIEQSLRTSARNIRATFRVMSVWALKLIMS